MTAELRFEGGHTPTTLAEMRSSELDHIEHFTRAATTAS
jgi:hypothetical protein